MRAGAPRAPQGVRCEPCIYSDVFPQIVALGFLVCVDCRRISELAEGYIPGEANRGEWTPFREEHRGSGHRVLVGQAVGQ
jgi:hypothetical protein